MKVYLGYQCYYDYCDIWESVAKVFDDELKAIAWKEEFPYTEQEWRNYVEWTVE